MLLINNTAEKRLLKVVFLDRDGVINRDSPDYIKSRAEFQFLPGSLEALRRLAQNGLASSSSPISRPSTAD
jgi:D-glycero-D-manno-heptose 1,7-bisphosphate phosphatase